jgi:hypothetical protein
MGGHGAEVYVKRKYGCSINGELGQATLKASINECGFMSERMAKNRR